MALQGPPEHPGIPFRHAFFQAEFVNKGAAQHVHAAGIPLSGGKPGPGQGFRIAGFLAPVAEQHQVGQVRLAAGVPFLSFFAEAGGQLLPLFRRDVFGNASQRNEVPGGGFRQAIVQQRSGGFRGRLVHQIRVFHLGQAQLGQGMAFFRRLLVPRAHVLLRFMGFAYGIHGIGQFLLPQLAQLDAGIRVSKLGGQLQLLVRFGIGGKLVELFLGKGKRFLQEGHAPFVMKGQQVQGGLAQLLLLRWLRFGNQLGVPGIGIIAAQLAGLVKQGLEQVAVHGSPFLLHAAGEVAQQGFQISPGAQFRQKLSGLLRGSTLRHLRQ